MYYVVCVSAYGRLLSSDLAPFIPGRGPRSQGVRFSRRAGTLENSTLDDISRETPSI